MRCTFQLLYHFLPEYMIVYDVITVYCFPMMTSSPPTELCRGSAGIPLRDQDATNLKEGDWIKINTLGHYKLDEMVSA